MEGEKSAVLLEGILETLKSINAGLQEQNRKWQWLEERLGSTESVDKREDRKSGQEEVLPTGEKKRGKSQEPEDNHSIVSSVGSDMISFVERSKLPPLADDAVENPLDDEAALEHVDSPHTSDSASSVALSETNRSHTSVNSFKQLQDSAAWQIESRAKKISVIDYRNLTSPLANSPLQHNALVQKEIGDAWMIPEDGRLPLNFSRESLERLSDAALGRLLPVLANFRDKMKPDGFVDFKIIDDYASLSIDRRGRMTYRLGDHVKGHLRVPIGDDREGHQNAPWRRFIFCQGLNTAKPNYEDFQMPEDERPDRYAPFLSGTIGEKNWGYYFSNLGAHCRCDHLRFSDSWRGEVNRYENRKNAFHITFLEIMPSYSSHHPKFEERGTWKQGPLYGDWDKSRLCESSVTLIEVPGIQVPLTPVRYLREERLFSKPVETWTIMLLSPPRFIARRLSTPYDMDMPMHSMALDLISSCLHNVISRWTELRESLESLLDEGAALFHPELHDKLLWDDETFSRSRKYFWAINCLTEIHLSISDNISQWEKYHEARIEPLRKANTLSRIDINKLRELEEASELLKNLQHYFSEKLTATKALRDGLFNASAVVESRASTRLGENVKLLTLVSIFFLPLAFCTSLWSINNMFSTTTLIYTIIIIGLSTYLIVFNLNNLVLQASKAYRSLRDQLVKKMKDTKEGNNEWGFWSQKGERFDVFRPQHEKAHPSEWWILIFLARQILMKAITFLHLHRPKQVSEEKSESSFGSSSASDSASTVSLASVINTPSASTISRDSVHAQEAGNDQDGAQNQQMPGNYGNNPEETGNSTAIQNTLRRDLLQERFSPAGLLRSATLTTVQPQPEILARLGNEQVENGGNITHSEAPLPPSTRRGVASKAISKFFRRKKKNVMAKDNGLV